MIGSSKSRRRLLVLALATVSVRVSAQTTSFLSVDINGGYIGSPTNAGQNCTNLGWDGTANQPVGGFTWTPWGGPGPVTIQPNTFPNNQGGDDIQLPMTGGGAPGNVGGYPTTSITKTFTGLSALSSGALTVALTGAGNPAVTFLNARDRGTGGGTTNYANNYRDFIFVTTDTGVATGGTPLQVSVGGLNPNTTYEFTSFAYDDFGLAQFVFGAVNPLPYNYQPTAEQVEASGQFANPVNALDGSLVGPRVSQFGGALATATSPYQFASTFKMTSDASGNAVFYEWANVGFTGVQRAAVFNGFQVGTVSASNWTAPVSTNWGDGFTTVPDADHAVAQFGSFGSAQSVTVEGSGRTVGVLNIVSPNPYSISGGTLTMNDSFGPDPNLPPPNGSHPSLVSSTTGHSQINVGGPGPVTHSIAAPVALVQQTSITTGPGATLNIAGNISGSTNKGINKLGTGSLNLSGSNTYSGTTNIYAGRLNVNGTHNGGNEYTVGAGAVLGGDGTIILRDDFQQRGASGPVPGRVTVWHGGIISPGNSIGTLTMDRLGIGSPPQHGSATIGFSIEVGSGTADRIVVTDTNGVEFTNAAGTVTISVLELAGATAGQYPILDYVGSIVDMAGSPLANINRFTLASTTVGNLSLALVDNTANTSIDLAVIIGPPPPSSWTGNTNANWSIAGNWTGFIPNAVDAVANFGTVASGQYAVNVDGAKTVGTINLNGPNSYTLSGSAITMQAGNGAPQINVNSGSHTIAAPITMNNFLFINTFAGSSLNVTGAVTPTVSGRQLVKDGNGTAQFARLNVGSGAVQLGTIQLNAGTIRISPKGTAGDPTGTSRAGALNIVAGGRFDLTNNMLVVETGVPATIRNQIIEGRNGGAWNGTGLTSASAAAVAANGANNNKTGLGYASASDIGVTTFGGETVTGAMVLVRYTLNGDGNLDGVVDGLDFTSLATNFNQAGKVWFQGDFNYDGTVNTQDFAAIAANFGAVPAPGGALGTLVPEPSAIGALVVVAAMGARRRRKQ